MSTLGIKVIEGRPWVIEALSSKYSMGIWNVEDRLRVSKGRLKVIAEDTADTHIELSGIACRDTIQQVTPTMSRVPNSVKERR